MHDRQPSEGRAGLMRRLIVVLSLGALSAGCASSGWFGSPSDASRAASPPPTLAQPDERLREGRRSPPESSTPASPLSRRGTPRTRAPLQSGAAPHRSRGGPVTTGPRSAPSTGSSRSIRGVSGKRMPARGMPCWPTSPRARWSFEARDGELGVREAELARLRVEAARLGFDLQRLRKIDLNLERRR